MKKTVSLALILVLFSVLLSSCVNLYPLKLYGIFESENPNIRLFRFEHTNDSRHSEDSGVIINADGSETKIVFENHHGTFGIFEFRRDGLYGAEGTKVLFEGKCRQKNGTIVLTVDDGTEIVLKKVEDLPENDTEYFFDDETHTYEAHGVFENSEYGITINRYIVPNTKNDSGEIANADGTKTKISFMYFRDDFWICEYREDGNYVSDETVDLFEGKWLSTGDAITLKLNNGSEIVLNKVAELPDNETESAS